MEERCPIGEKREIDISSLAARCSLDIICGKYLQLEFGWKGIDVRFIIECAFGIRFNAQREDSKYVKAERIYDIERIVHIVVEGSNIHGWSVTHFFVYPHLEENTKNCLNFAR